KVLRPGLHVGTFEKKRFEPSHSLALALKMQDVKQVLEADVEAGEPEKYLRGESLVTEGGKGWTLVCAQGHPMGWGKVSNGMLKNHYPKGLRR
ncbi:MAG: RsmF rRNA methyltransferase first C-terminal domain-containing protein, partial [Lachnospiraceae bacterium]|nr:RsmF rRNA methyltransferase first C-terminal domain-containing protein [Lachnospiraceae bacterium]